MILLEPLHVDLAEVERATGSAGVLQDGEEEGEAPEHGDPAHEDARGVPVFSHHVAQEVERDHGEVHFPRRHTHEQALRVRTQHQRHDPRRVENQDDYEGDSGNFRISPRQGACDPNTDYQIQRDVHPDVHYRVIAGQQLEHALNRQVDEEDDECLRSCAHGERDERRNEGGEQNDVSHGRDC